jgi:hypothetical protein
LIALLLSGTAVSAQPGRPWREMPAFVPLFAPSGIRAGAYRTYISPLDLEAALRGLAGDTTLVRAPGAWQPRTRLPSDAFGQAGAHDRWKLARLYGGRQPRVARGTRIDGHVAEMWTLISPFPDADFRRLEAGTLLIVLRLP